MASYHLAIIDAILRSLPYQAKVWRDLKGVGRNFRLVPFSGLPSHSWNQQTKIFFSHLEVITFYCHRAADILREEQRFQFQSRLLSESLSSLNSQKLANDEFDGYGMIGF